MYQATRQSVVKLDDANDEAPLTPEEAARLAGTAPTTADPVPPLRGPYGPEYGNEIKPDGTFDPPTDAQWMMYNCREYLNLEQEKVLLDHAEEYHLSLDDINRLQNDLLRKILGRREHILNDPLYLFLQHVAGTMGNTHVEDLYVTDEGSRAERIQVLYEQLIERSRIGTSSARALQYRLNYNREDTALERQDNIRRHAKAELDQTAPVPLTTPTLLAMVRDINISGRIMMKPNVFQATQKLMTELSQKRGCNALGKMHFMDLLLQYKDEPRLATIMGEITAYNIMVAHQLDPRRDYKVIDYNRVMRNADDAWTRLVLLLREIGVVEKKASFYSLRGLQTW